MSGVPPRSKIYHLAIRIGLFEDEKVLCPMDAVFAKYRFLSADETWIHHYTSEQKQWVEQQLILNPTVTFWIRWMQKFEKKFHEGNALVTTVGNHHNNHQIKVQIA